MNEKIKMALKISNQLLQKTPEEITNRRHYTEVGGIYVFFWNKEKIYIGKTNNLKRRINDHLSGERGNTMSGSFREGIKEKFGVAFGPVMREWVMANCKIVYIEIDDPDMRSLVEMLFVSVYRTEKLLNKF